MAENPKFPRQYCSERGIPLVYYGDPPGAPLLTMENPLCQWFNLTPVIFQGMVETCPETR
jgi:hypothetical protein